MVFQLGRVLSSVIVENYGGHNCVYTIYQCDLSYASYQLQFLVMVVVLFVPYYLLFFLL